jgi:hypothetical protein
MDFSAAFEMAANDRLKKLCLTQRLCGSKLQFYLTKSSFGEKLFFAEITFLLMEIFVIATIR